MFAFMRQGQGDGSTRGFRLGLYQVRTRRSMTCSESKGVPSAWVCLVRMTLINSSARQPIWSTAKPPVSEARVDYQSSLDFAVHQQAFNFSHGASLGIQVKIITSRDLLDELPG